MNNRVISKNITNNKCERQSLDSLILVDRPVRHFGLLHGLKLINPLLGLALADLPQGLVLVSASTDIVLVYDVVLGLSVLIAGLLQV